MLKMLSYLLSVGVVTVKDLPSVLPEETRAMPVLTENPCVAPECNICESVCPTNAIVRDSDADTVTLDLGACINCSLCIVGCPSKTIASDKNFISVVNRDDLLFTTAKSKKTVAPNAVQAEKNIFRKSIACRVVSTGCSACDLELSACTNPIFDIERFGASIVASPRFADVLLVTGPVPKAMHEALRSCYMAMSEPRKVVAVGSCACSGGIHRDGYAEANGVANILPVDLFIPGCPPHPWAIIDGLRKLMSLTP
ncbi:MAG TPA: NADH-quinone oxidoreductase subunit NuoB [Drouetiella sp.]|jgi:Ni,Fe-hydrogenase III small subunit/ferredoxin